MSSRLPSQNSFDAAPVTALSNASSRDVQHESSVSARTFEKPAPMLRCAPAHCGDEMGEWLAMTYFLAEHEREVDGGPDGIGRAAVRTETRLRTCTDAFHDLHQSVLHMCWYQRRASVVPSLPSSDGGRSLSISLRLDRIAFSITSIQSPRFASSVACGWSC